MAGVNGGKVPVSTVHTKRKRTFISSSELAKLEKLFEGDPWPNRSRREQLASDIDKSENFVSVWFQNKRARFKRQGRLKQLNRFTAIKENQEDTTTPGEGGGAVVEPVGSASPVPAAPRAAVKAGCPCSHNMKKKGPAAIPAATNPSPSGTRQVKSSDCREFAKQQGPFKLDKENEDFLLLLDEPLYASVFKRIIGMVAAAESVLDISSPDFSVAFRDAQYGIRLKHNAIISYNKIYGLSVADDGSGPQI